MEAHNLRKRESSLKNRRMFSKDLTSQKNHKFHSVIFNQAKKVTTGSTLTILRFHKSPSEINRALKIQI